MRYFIIVIIALLTAQSIYAQKISVGAIRWDAWYGPGLSAKAVKAGIEVERSLGPQKYHYRAPFFSKEIGKDSIQCREITQRIMDQDIAYAKYSGIDYWAFCWYHDTTGLGLGRKLYLSSKVKDKINWCLILGTEQLDINLNGSWLKKRWAEKNYQKVLNGRPLVYIYGLTNYTTAADIKKLRNLGKEIGVDPYIVLMQNQFKKVDLDANTVDAVSQYNSYAGGNGIAYYPTMLNMDKKGWENYAKTGKQVVPWVTSGRNQKPRIDHQVSWMSTSGWVADATPGQIVENLKNAFNWINTNNNLSPANTVIVYAWNEFDEGGWLCPTLGPDSSRIKALRKFLLK
jgi:hypothetical protein